MSVRDDGFGGFTVGPSDEFFPEYVTHITLVEPEDDWQGLYVDGRLVDENHSLSLVHVFERLTGLGPQFKFHILRVTDEWMMDQGRLPANLGDIPPEARL